MATPPPTHSDRAEAKCLRAFVEALADKQDAHDLVPDDIPVSVRMAAADVLLDADAARALAKP